MVYTSLVQPGLSGSPGLPGLDRQPMTWDGEMLKETASPEVSLKPLSLAQSGGFCFFLGDAEKLKKKATMEMSPREGPSAYTASAESGAGAVGQCPSGEALPMLPCWLQ